MADPAKGTPPTKWKLLIVKWLGLFPTILVISYSTKWLGLKPLALKLAVETLILVPLLAYVVTPMMDSIFSEWLYAGKDTPKQHQSVDLGS
ncbi:hypothetical protein [Lewinella sp. 4G2]|uniref:hypothetical protein n=1 Tax=Lewinella sp. 4G2 TaxID=1803372 RepID=UPI0007B49301|nr:hypothetical protein [Lewinella sp. 4G2]OAV46028.1 hypothetical protein A3850_017300 [Lewinella sp. 4G2]